MNILHPNHLSFPGILKNKRYTGLSLETYRTDPGTLIKVKIKFPPSLGDLMDEFRRKYPLSQKSEFKGIKDIIVLRHLTSILFEINRSDSSWAKNRKVFLEFETELPDFIIEDFVMAPRDESDKWSVLLEKKK